MNNSFLITIQDGSSCEARHGESVLSALVRAGITVSAPCGGRGICGKCRLNLLDGSVRLSDTNAEVKAGSSFCACKAEALCGITVSLEEDFLSDNFIADNFFAKTLAAKTAERKVERAGIGIDIGTTTVQAQLVCLNTGEILETFSALNKQRGFGADVMSRIAAARNGKLKELSAAIGRQVEEVLRQCIDKWNLRGIEHCAVSGNTAMLHLFAGVDPSAMGEAPYTPVFLEERHFEGKELSLCADRVTLLPGISAFVGADTTAGLAFLDIMNKKGNAIFIDIGTNGEIALWKENCPTKLDWPSKLDCPTSLDLRKLICCSTAAGPCFEGAEISCGMGAEAGAINRISFKGDDLRGDIFNYGPLSYTTLGNVKARGVCGAGLIDAIAVMKKLGAIDETGALAEKYSPEGFPLAENIVVTQKDVRQFQLAKAAIFSGIKILCKTAGLEMEEIDTAYIAGGLGFFINLDNAAAVGLIPSALIGKTAVCGNTSLKGAVKSLTDLSFLPRCREIASRAVTEELALNKDFAEEFTDNMMF